MVLSMNFILFLIFLVLIILVGGGRGVMTLMALLGNITVFFCSVYLMKYNDPYKIVFVDIVFMCLLTLLYQNGLNVKTLSALVAVLVVSLILIKITRLIAGEGNMGGYNEFEMYEDNLMNLSVNIYLNIHDVAISMLVLGVTGALIDIAVAVTSSMHEVWTNNKDITDDNLFKTGMTLGKSILGSTINTMWFACIGEFLLMFLMFRKYQYSFPHLINSKAFFDIICNIILSATGCCVVVPISAFAFVKILRYQQKKKECVEE